MLNEILFFIEIIFLASTSLIALYLGKKALVGFICVQGILSNLFVTKQMMLFGFDVTCSDVFAVGVIFGLNLLQEFYGKEVVKKAIVTNFFMLSFYLVISQIQILYIPNHFDSMHQHFVPLLELMPRIAGASVTVYLLVQFFDAYFYQYLKKLFVNKYLMLRTMISLTCSQVLDTVLFTFLALYGIVGSVCDVIFVSLFIKLIIIACTSPFCTLAQKLMQRKKLS